jgi:hypothetical protein
VTGVPMLSKKKTFFSKTEPVKTILFEDIYRCVDRKEAEMLLIDPYAEEELIRHLQERYGLIDDFFFINYDVEKILAKVGENMTPVKKDVTDEFEA